MQVIEGGGYDLIRILSVYKKQSARIILYSIKAQWTQFLKPCFLTWMHVHVVSPLQVIVPFESFW